jgi:hypothetical protein
MRIVCSPNPTSPAPRHGVAFTMYRQPQVDGFGTAGAALFQEVRRRRLRPSLRSWDFLTIALAVVAADHASLRKDSPDGWTRQFELDVAVCEPEFWRSQTRSLKDALAFLTGDQWRIVFRAGGIPPPRLTRRSRSRRPEGDSVCLLSGGIDSLVGAIDLVAGGGQPVFVSQVERGAGTSQQLFASHLRSEESSHLPLSPGIRPPGESDWSQRARSILFLALGVVAASSLPTYRDGANVELFVPENGFISLNVPLTPLRLGSLSTRTTHPFFIGRIQEIFDSSGIMVSLKNPYRFKTKGEMLRDCMNQEGLKDLVQHSISCGKYKRWNYEHCGRCLPCLVRRAAFLKWGQPDLTSYHFRDLSIRNDQHADYDDVRSAAFAVLQCEAQGVERWAGSALSTALLGDPTGFETVALHGVEELEELLRSYSLV